MHKTYEMETTWKILHEQVHIYLNRDKKPRITNFKRITAPRNEDADRTEEAQLFNNSK